MKNNEERSRFAKRFEEAYNHATLPRAYREFILSDSYLPYRKSLLRGLWTYGPAYVELNLGSSILLRRYRLFEESGIDSEDATEFHPIATLRQSPQFLAIRTTEEAGPVFLWHHETGAFHLQFETFSDFLENLRTPEQVREERANLRKTFAGIRRDCKPALSRTRKHFKNGELEAAAGELDRVLQHRSPIRYNGHNDFNAIGILCDCFNLRGRILLAQDRLEAARVAFLDAIACGGTPYWEALVNVVVTSFLLEDIEPVFERVGGVTAADFGRPPGTILKQNFSPSQLQQFAEAARSHGGSDEQRAFATEVLGWLG